MTDWRCSFSLPFSSPPRRHRPRLWTAAAVMAAGALTTVAFSSSAASAHEPGFAQVNLVSDMPGVALQTDPNLVNPWGMSATPGTDAAPGSPVWVSDNGTDKATLYSRNPMSGAFGIVGLVVNITGGAPTGQVFNGGGGFAVHDAAGHSASALFLFASENGEITGWNPGVGATGPGTSTVAETAVDNGANAVYKGLAIATASNGNTYLYAANFRSGRVEVYDSNFTPTQLTGLFSDPRLPAGYAPFDIQELGGFLYVTYAKQDPALHDDVAGQGHGFVDKFTNDGVLVRRLVSRGQLDSPWGLAIAPVGFGRFGSALLVGNFGNGQINAYNADTGAHLGTLRGEDGHRIVIDGLWALRFGNGNAAGTNELLFTAGPDGETHGLLGKLVSG